MPKIKRFDIAVYLIPKDAPESDGTSKWNHNDLITVHAHADGNFGLRWTCAAKAVAIVIDDLLK